MTQKKDKGGSSFLAMKKLSRPKNGAEWKHQCHERMNCVWAAKTHSPSRQSFRYPFHPFSDCWFPGELQWVLWYGIQILQEGPIPLWTHQLGKEKSWLEFEAKQFQSAASPAVCTLSLLLIFLVADARGQDFIYTAPGFTLETATQWSFDHWITEWVSTCWDWIIE